MNKPFYGAASMPHSNRSTILNNLQVPGPGSYDYNKEKSHNDLPKWSLKKQLPHGSCFQNLSITPGPGGYECETGFKKQQSKLITTKGQKYRHFIEKSYSHSPLNIPGCLNAKGGFSFGYREEVKEVQASPGPIYHLDKVVEEERTKQIHDSFRGFGFGEKNIIYKKNDCSPGPGAFDVQQASLYKSKTCENWTFGSARRSQSPNSNPLGPGQYDPKVDTTLGRIFKLRGKNETKNIQTSNVGPGSYDLPETKTKIGTRFNIRRTKQQNSKQQAKQDEKLSPFTYNPPRYLDKSDTNGYSLGKRLESSLTQGVTQHPGPGSYQIGKNQIKKGGGYMGRKMQQKKKESSTMDNFYKYEPKINSVARQSPKFSFPQSRRSNQKQNGLSASYSQEFYQNVNNNKIAGYSYSMGTSKRFDALKKESGPFKDSQVEYSTIGQLPGYRGLKKK